MENGKSVWNKTIFSETLNKYDDNFQIMNMKYKIKNSKNRKKENYKNIEELENIYNNNPIIEGLKSKKKTTKTDKNEKPKSESKSRDFDPNFLGLPDKDFEGIDNPDKGNKDDPRVAVINILKKIYEKINKFNYTIALYIAKTLSVAGSNEQEFGELLRKGANSRKLNQKNDSKRDILIIQKYVGLFESILVAFFATYNWFYIMFYYYTTEDNETNKTGEDNTGNRVEVPELSSYYIQERIHQRADFLSIFYAFVNFFFIFALAFVEYLQSFMMKIIPDNLMSIFNYKGCFVGVFVLFILFFFNFSVFIYKFLIAVLRGDTKDVIVSLMYFFLLVIYFFGNYNMGFLPKTLSYTVNSFMGFILSPITGFITAFLRFIIVMLISVPLGALACMLYLLINSLFGIMINVDFFKYFGTFYRINEFIRNNNDPEENKPKSNEDEFIYKVKSSYNKLIDFVYKYVFFIAYIIILVLAIVDYNSNITNNKLKLHLIILSAILIFALLVSMAGIYFMKDYDEKPPNPTAPKFKQQNTDSLLNSLFDTVMGNFTKFIPSSIIDKLPVDLKDITKNLPGGLENITKNLPGGLENITKNLPGGLENIAPELNDVGNSDIGNTLKGLYKTTDNVESSAPQNNVLPSAPPYDVLPSAPQNNVATNNDTGSLVDKMNTDVINNVVPPVNSLVNNIQKNSIVDKINQTPFMSSMKEASNGLSSFIPNVSSAIQKQIKNYV